MTRTADNSPPNGSHVVSPQADGHPAPPDIDVTKQDPNAAKPNDSALRRHIDATAEEANQYIAG